MKYTKGYKYRLEETEFIETPIKGYEIVSDYVALNSVGTLEIRKAYCWDGASGPTIDTKSAMRGSLVHDALYQIIRKGFLPFEMRGVADQMFYDICIIDGMWRLRAALWLFGVRNFASFAARPWNDNKIYAAP